MKLGHGASGGSRAALAAAVGRGEGIDLRPALYCLITLTAQASSPVKRTSRVVPDRQYFLPIADCSGVNCGGPATVTCDVTDQVKHKMLDIFHLMSFLRKMPGINA